MQGKHSVQIEDFTERYFIKSFQKKYKNKWDVTLIAIVAELARIDKLLETDKVEIIINSDDFKIIKTKFKVAGTQESAKTSGNRCIVVWYPHKQLVKVLLVYCKTDLGSGHENAEWKSMVSNNYSEYKEIIGTY